MQAVSALQRREGLPANGVADQVTWETVVNAYEPALIRVDKAAPIEIIMNPGKVYRRGDTDPNLYLLQSILIQLAQDNSTIPIPEHNGVLDEVTSRALAEFQLLAGLPITGELDKITWKHIVRHYTANVHKNTAASGYSSKYEIF